MAVPVIEATTSVGEQQGSSITIDVPTGTAADDLLVAVFYTEADEATATGWNKIVYGFDTLHSVSISAYWRVATGSEPSDYTFTGLAATDYHGGAMLRISGADTSAPIVFGASRTRTGQGVNTVSLGALTTSIDDCLGIAAIGTWATVSSGATATGWTGGPGFDYGRVLYRDVATAGTVAAVNTNISENDSWATATFAVKPAPNEIATDAFTRSNGGVGANYSTPTGTTEVQVVSNTAQGPTDATTYVSSWSADTFDNDQWAEADVTLGGTSSEGAVYVRLATGGAFTGYGFIWDTAASGTYRIVEVTAGSEANIGSTSTGVGTTGTKTLRLEVVGTALTAYVDGVEVLTTTDATITAGEPGIGMYRSSGATATLDDFSAGDWTTPSGDATATPSVVAATTTVPAPTVTATSSVSVSPATVAVACSVPSPSVSAASNATATPTTINAVGSVDSPTITAEANALATANVVAGLVAIPPPSVTAGAASNVPQNLVATTFSSSRIDLTWDAVAGATGYDLRYEAGAIIVEDHGTTSYSDTGLDPSTLYSYEVRAVLS